MYRMRYFGVNRLRYDSSRGRKKARAVRASSTAERLEGLAMDQVDAKALLSVEELARFEGSGVMPADILARAVAALGDKGGRVLVPAGHYPPNQGPK